MERQVRRRVRGDVPAASAGGAGAGHESARRPGRRRDLEHLVTLVHADLATWRPRAGSYALVLCIGFWAEDVFPAAADAVAPGGLLGEPGSLLPPGFTVLDQHDLPERGRRQLLARRQ